MGAKKWTHRFHVEPGQALTVQLLCLGVLFGLGMLGGYLYAGHCAGSSRLALSAYLKEYCALYQEGSVAAVSLFTAVRLYFFYTLGAFLLGLLAVGVLALPILTAAYGFLTMFAVASFSQVYGRGGTLLALAAFGPRVLFTLPCFLWVAACSWAAASALVAGGGGKRCAPAVTRDSAYLYRLFLCVMLLAFGVCFERYITPSLFQWALGAAH